MIDQAEPSALDGSSTDFEPSNESSVLWGAGESFDLSSLSPIADVEPVVEPPAAEPAPKQDVDEEEEVAEDDVASYPVAPRRSWGSAFFSLFLLLLLAAAGALAFMWLQQDVKRQSTDSNLLDGQSESGSGAPQRETTQRK